MAWSGEDQGGYIGGGASAQQGGGYGAGAGARQSGGGGGGGGAQGGGNQTADIAKAAGGATQVLLSAIMGNKVLKKQKEQKAIQKAARYKQFADSMNLSLLDESEGNIANDRLKHDMGAEAGAAGAGESSAKKLADSDAAHANDMRSWALRKQRADLKYGYEMGRKLEHLQKQIERIQRQEAMIAAGIDTVVSVASIASDRGIKKDFASVDSWVMLEKVAQLPIVEWTYDSEKTGVRHVGPMAQDFAKIFGLGEDDTRIAVVDGLGVALAAIKALAAHAASQQERIKELELKVQNGR